MKLKTKKIVAREVLIAITSIGIILITLFVTRKAAEMDFAIMHLETVYGFVVQTDNYALRYSLDLISDYPTLQEKIRLWLSIDENNGVSVKLHRGIINDLLVEVQELRSSWIVRFHREFAILSIILLAAAYPARLLLWLIWWSVHTLKTKEETQ